MAWVWQALSLAGPVNAQMTGTTIATMISTTPITTTMFSAMPLKCLPCVTCYHVTQAQEGSTIATVCAAHSASTTPSL